MKFFKGIALSLFVLLSCSAVQAQKIGHIDYTAVLTAMPEVKVANSQLEALEKQLTRQLESMQTKAQAKQQEALALAKTDKLTPQMEQQYTAELTKMQEDIQKAYSNSEQQVAKRREALLKPIIEKLEGKIKDVAAAKGLGYVLDAGQLHYMGGGTDITPDVRKALGLQ